VTLAALRTHVYAASGAWVTAGLQFISGV